MDRPARKFTFNFAAFCGIGNGNREGIMLPNLLAEQLKVVAGAEGEEAKTIR